jgi:hypothetical protein
MHEEPTRRALADAHVRIYADANHGFLYQYPELFGDLWVPKMWIAAGVAAV